MKITRAHEDSRVAMVGTTDDERDLLRYIRDNAAVDSLLEYEGRSGGRESGKPLQLSFMVGTRKITVGASDEESLLILGGLRNAIFFGGGGLILLRHATRERSTEIEFCVGKCRECEAPMSTMGECESRLCNSCSKNCECTYEVSSVHGGEIELGLGRVCTKCNRTDPDTLVIPNAASERAHEEYKREAEARGLEPYDTSVLKDDDTHPDYLG